jgi:predicted short-subunit dehydrogenase-like oxidoreductase (DUF2520 family)
MERKPDIAIVGPGVVGTALGVLAAGSGYRVAAVGGRRAPQAKAAAARIGPGVRSCRIDEAARCGRLVLLTVPDDAIETVCGELARAGAFARGAVVAHCSGALSSEVLAPARDRCGAAVGSLHPLQTFADVDAAVAAFPGTHCFIEGDEPAAGELAALAEAIGGRAVRIAADAKPLYHAAAVLACSHLTCLLDAALVAAGRAGIPGAQAGEALRPLVEATVANVFRTGPAAALTGPIARGDHALVARQVRRLAAEDPHLAALYRALGEWAVALALRKGSIDPPAAERLRKALAGGD